MEKSEINKLVLFWQDASSRDLAMATDIFNRTEKYVNDTGRLHEWISGILKKNQ